MSGKKGCYSLPCGKFLVAMGVTVGTLVFGCSMLATGGGSAPLAPFYCSLITGSVAFWSKPPGYSDDSPKEVTKPEEKPKDEKTLLISN
jgi:hypothetical protein